MTKTITAVFDRHEQALQAARQIKDEGLRTDDISIIAKDKESADYTSTQGAQHDGHEAVKGTPAMGYGRSGIGAMGTGLPGFAGMSGAAMGTGAAMGAGTTEMETSKELTGDKKQIKDNISDGVIAGGILGSITGLLIGAGSMVIPGLGIIAAAGPITGILAGGATGAIVGGLIDLGIPENKSKEYETDIKAGKIIFSMKAEKENFERIGEILRGNGAISVETY